MENMNKKFYTEIHTENENGADNIKKKVRVNPWPAGVMFLVILAIVLSCGVIVWEGIRYNREHSDTVYLGKGYTLVEDGLGVDGEEYAGYIYTPTGLVMAFGDIQEMTVYPEVGMARVAVDDLWYFVDKDLVQVAREYEE